MYFIEVRNDELGKYRLIKGTDRRVVEQKAAAQSLQWNELWRRKLQKEKNRSEKERMLFNVQNKKEEAKRRSIENEDEFKNLNNVLLQTIKFNDAINWDSLKDHSQFFESKPHEVSLKILPIKPDEADFTPQFGLMESIFIFARRKKIISSRKLYHEALANWQKDCNEVEAYNKKIRDSNYMAIREWEQRQRIFDEIKVSKNLSIEAFRQRYLAKDANAITEYCDLVLARSQYPDYFPQRYDLDYISNNQTLIIEYILPHISILPTLKEIAYNQSKDSFKETHISDAQLGRIYDKLIYDITLRTIHEIYESDTVLAINAVAFNGNVEFINPANGKLTSSCIVSIYTTREEFSEINLQLVDSKACFKALKGIGSSKLHSIAPIVPIMKMDKSDKRFIDSYEVQDDITDSTNIAMMDWKDFEQLVRELFEKEFSGVGGDVKVTQSSRDGGVDAVIFDPDPIRGGKIVVQAKRYSNTVGVSAVRDLFGTVTNEGANKGILITTSDYGPDAYTFAKDKPLTLLNGGHLLHLISKHGKSARIDLKEAKKNASSNYDYVNTREY